MTGKTHMICSTATIVSMAVVLDGHVKFGVVDIPLYVSVLPVAIGAWLPDIDIEQSRLGSKFKILSKKLSHRGPTHALVCPAALFVLSQTVQTLVSSIVAIPIVSWLTWTLYGFKKGLISIVALALCHFFLPNVEAALIFGLGFGWLLHIIEDLFNTKGCPLLWPLSKKRTSIPVVGIIKTRHWSEYLFMLLWLGGCGLWVYWSLGGI